MVAKAQELVGRVLVFPLNRPDDGEPEYVSYTVQSHRLHLPISLGKHLLLNP
jgi:hypothetical protein